MWNYVTYRDAIAIVGLDADAVYPEGSDAARPGRVGRSRLADVLLRAAAGGRRGDARRGQRRARSTSTRPDLIEPLRDAAAARARPRARRRLRGRSAPRAHRPAIALSLHGLRRSRRRGHPVATPATSTSPPPCIAAGGVPVPVPIGPETGHRLDPDVVAAAITPRTRAICLVDPINPYGVVPDRGRARGARRPGRRATACCSSTTSRTARSRSTPTRRVHVAAGAAAVRQTRGDVLGLALLRHGRRADRVPRRAAAADARLPAAEGGADAPEHEPDLPARRAGRAARRGLPATCAPAVVRRNLAHLQETLGDVRRARAWRSRRSAAWPARVDVSASGATAQEVMVALFARRIAVYPGDGLGESGAATTLRLNLSRPDPWAMEHLRARAARGARRGGRRPLARAGRGAARAQGHGARRPAGGARAERRVSALDLVAEHGSPLWLADVDRVRANARRFLRTWETAWPDVEPRLLLQDQPHAGDPARVRRRGRSRPRWCARPSYGLARDVVGTAVRRGHGQRPGQARALLRRAAALTARSSLADSAAELSRLAAAGVTRAGLRVGDARHRRGVDPLRDRAGRGARGRRDGAPRLGLRVEALGAHRVSIGFGAPLPGGRRAGPERRRPVAAARRPARGGRDAARVAWRSACAATARRSRRSTSAAAIRRARRSPGAPGPSPRRSTPAGFAGA